MISQTPPAYVIKYNVSNNKYLTLDLSTTLPDAITTAGRPQALIYNSFYTGVSTPLLYLAAGNSPAIGNNKIYGINPSDGNVYVCDISLPSPGWGRIVLSQKLINLSVASG